MPALSTQMRWMVGAAFATVALVAAVASTVLRETGRPQAGVSSREAEPPPPAAAAAKKNGPEMRPIPPPSPSKPAPVAQRPQARPADASLAFDVVRVEPTGSAVIAGHGAPALEVALLDGDRRIETVKADASGQFVFLPPALTAGEHVLRLEPADRAGPEGAGVAVTVPADHKGQVVVAALAKGAMSPTARPAATQAPAATAPAAAVSIRSIEIDRHGALLVTGDGMQDHALRLLLNRSFLASVRPQLDRKWSVRVEKGLEPGRYDIRVDDMRDGGNDVVASAQATFEYAGEIQANLAAADRSLVPRPGGADAAANGWLATALAGTGASAEKVAAPAAPVSAAGSGLKPMPSVVIAPHGGGAGASSRPQASPTVFRRVTQKPFLGGGARVTRPRVVQTSIRYGGRTRAARAALLRPPTPRGRFARFVPAVRSPLRPSAAHVIVPRIRAIPVRPGPTHARIVKTNGGRNRNPRRIFTGQVIVLPAQPVAGTFAR